jgi:hypothetical protein
MVFYDKIKTIWMCRHYFFGGESIMKNIQKACLTDILGTSNCPHCGSSLKAVEYFTARPVSQAVTNQTLDSKTITTTYTDIAYHIGGICLPCVHKERKAKRIIGLALLIVGGISSGVAMMTGLVLSAIAERDGKDVGAAIGTPMALMVILLLVALVGLIIYANGNEYSPKKYLIPERLFLLITKRIKKESPTVGVVYLTPALAAQLQKK